MKKHILIALITISLLQIFCTHKTDEQKRTKSIIPVSIYTVKEKTFLSSSERDGEILPQKRVYLIPTVTGTIVEMRKKIGDMVKKGEIVAIVDHRVIDDKIKALSEQIRAIKAKRLLLQKDTERFERLYKKDAVSKHRYEEVKAEYTATLSQEKALISDLNSLKERLKDYFVKSPINGTIADKLCDTGNIAAGKPIYIIDDLNWIKIQSSVPENLFNKLTDKSYLIATIPAINKKIKAGITRVSSSIDYLTRSGKIEATIQNRDRKIKPGMYVKVKVVTGTYKAPAIDRDALMKLPATGVYYVFVVKKDNTVQKVNLQLGRINGNYQEVISGLKKGDRVVVKGQGILKSGYRVEIKEIEKP